MIADASTFQRTFDVSRETLERLHIYRAVLEKWNPRINLVAPGTLPDIWNRHFADSAQLLALAPADAQRWADLGSGAGFPGLVVAAMARDRSDLDMTLIDSDVRKCAFLREAARQMDVSVTVITDRIDRLPPLDVDVLSARALAPLDSLLPYVEKHRRSTGTALFPKGAAVHKEVEAARRGWRFDAHLHWSLTDPDAAIVDIGALERV